MGLNHKKLHGSGRLVACRRESVTAVGTPQNQKRGHALRVPAIGAALPESLTNELTATGH